jgi:hypothetical protein
MQQSGLRDFIRGAAELIFPSTCWICESPAAELEQFRHGLCTACFAAVTTDSHHLCLRCGQIVGPHADITDGCAGCHRVGYGFQSVVRLGKYDGRLREAVLRMKTSAGESLFQYRCTGGVPGGGATTRPPPSPSNWLGASACHVLAIACAECGTRHNSYNRQPPRGGRMFVGHFV